MKTSPFLTVGRSVGAQEGARAITAGRLDFGELTRTVFRSLNVFVLA